MRLRGGGLPLVASLGPSARSLLGAVRRHWRLAPHHWSGAWRRWSNGDCRLEPHLDHCGQRTPAPPWKDRATGTRRRSGLYETPASLEQPCLPGRDRLPFPLVTADPVGQPLPSAVPTYGTTPPVGRESVPTGCGWPGACNIALVPGKTFLAQGIRGASRWRSGLYETRGVGKTKEKPCQVLI